MYDLYVQLPWPCVISKHIHTRTVIIYLTCCCGPVTTLALRAISISLLANGLIDGRPLSRKLTRAHRVWFRCAASPI